MVSVTEQNRALLEGPGVREGYNHKQMIRVSLATKGYLKELRDSILWSDCSPQREYSACRPFEGDSSDTITILSLWFPVSQIHSAKPSLTYQR